MAIPQVLTARFETLKRTANMSPKKSFYGPTQATMERRHKLRAAAPQNDFNINRYLKHVATGLFNDENAFILFQKAFQPADRFHI